MDGVAGHNLRAAEGASVAMGAMIFNGPLFSDTKFSKNFPAIMNCFNIAQPRVGEGQPFSKGQPRASAAIATLTATGEGHQHF
mgnify:CR=1